MKLPFWDHVEELRKILLRCGWAIFIATLLAFCFYKQLFTLLLAPLAQEGLYLFSPLEGFVTAAKLAFWAGLILASPIWLFYLIQFFLPALRAREKRLILPFLVLSGVFIVCGVLFAYTITLPFVMRFFQNFNAGLGQNLWSLKQTLDLAIALILAHALIFELFSILLFLIHLGLISHAQLRKIRKGTIVAIFILAAILTPPDVLSQLLLAFPMLILFEGALLYARFKNKAY